MIIGGPESGGDDGRMRGGCWQAAKVFQWPA
jgi:hypothetical protein